MNNVFDVNLQLLSWRQCISCRMAWVFVKSYQLWINASNRIVTLYLISAKIVFIATDFSFMVAESLIRTLQCLFSLCRRTHFELHLGLSMDSLHLAGSTFRSLRSTSLDLCSERFSLSSLQNLEKCRNRYFVRMTHKKKGWLQLCILINSLTVTLIWNNEYQ